MRFNGRHRLSVEPAEDEPCQRLVVGMFGKDHRRVLLAWVGCHRDDFPTDITESRATVESFHVPLKNIDKPGRLFP
jgi:hypothetical protein